MMEYLLLLDVGDNLMATLFVLAVAWVARGGSWGLTITPESGSKKGDERNNG